ncbi:hypothetical protein Poli38472_013069 [Pythium oligandrum]|uniref:Dienelactone hydrolase domain-containing protein n=1 Tax=Pythium oligandrum TaxID=41045 RepID=A0A8K1CJ76_PYTOL|nr:hypothetical protein Poli38472_013069 [Pythium oligandrum]|eukprot:TMW64447.1 hypothetical protein Poli38472_013069 [Pythium oligandrum]
MSSCCPPGSEPPRAASPHVGEIKRFAQTDLYVAGPRSAKVGVLAFTNVFGWDSGRTKQDADRLGEKGYAVVIVDVTKGDWMRMEDDIDATMGPWLRRTDYDNLVKPSIDDAIAYLQQEARAQQIVSYGYCYGGWIGARLSTVSPPLIKGHVSFHPSWVMEKMLHGEDAVEKMTEAIKVPQLLLSASNDPGFVRTGGSVERILKANPDISSLSEVVDYEYVRHGWVNRGDLTDEKVKAAVGDAWERTYEFFEKIID